MINEIFTITYFDNVIQGKITYLEKYEIHVEIVAPFKNYSNFRIISGIGKQNPRNFLTPVKRKETSEDLLSKIYILLKHLDDNLCHFTRSYKELLEERKLLLNLPDDKIKDQINDKLTDWFFESVIGYSRVISIFDKPKIEEILKVYLETGKKLYLQDLD